MLDLRTAALGARDDRISHLTDRELSPLFRFLLRVRISAVVLALTIITLLLVFDDGWWRAGVVGVVTLVLVALGIRDRVYLDAEILPARRAAQLLGSVLMIHGVLITLTGGIHSPFVVILPAVTFLLGVTVGRVRLATMAVSGVVVFVWLLAADDFVGPAPVLIPATFAEVLPQLGGPAFAITMAATLTMVCSVTATLALVVRGAVERAVASADEARSETLATMHDRNRELWTLSRAIAHELKNPLASVRGLGSLLARRVEEGTKEAERMKVMLEEVERMGSIIDEFLNFSRPLTEMTTQDALARDVVDKVITLYQPLAESHGVRLEARVSTAGRISCDPRKLVQVLVNLLHNAIEASPRGSTITLHARDARSEILLEVLDEGPGIDAQVRDRLFTPGITTKDRGSGIGLTVARAIAEQHGGTLELLDRSHGGCCARLSLPRATSPSAAEIPPSEEPSP